MLRSSTEVIRGEVLSVEEFRKKYPGSSEEQVTLYAAAVAAERARGPLLPEPDVPMPRITAEVTRGSTSPSRMTSPNRYVIRDWNPLDYPPSQAGLPSPSPTPDLTTDIRRIVLRRRLTPAERAAAERPDMSGDDLLALLAGVPNAREWEALEGGD